MGIFDWLLTDPSQAGGGFLMQLLNGKPGEAGEAPTTSSTPYGGSSSLLGDSPLVNLLRSGFAGMNAASGYSGFGPQFAAGMAGGSDAMVRRRQQAMQDRLDALALNRALLTRAEQEAAGGRDQAQPSGPGGGGRQPCASCGPAKKTASLDPLGIR